MHKTIKIFLLTAVAIFSLPKNGAWCKACSLLGVHNHGNYTLGISYVKCGGGGEDGNLQLPVPKAVTICVQPDSLVKFKGIRPIDKTEVPFKIPSAGQKLHVDTGYFSVSKENISSRLEEKPDFHAPNPTCVGGNDLIQH